MRPTCRRSLSTSNCTAGAARWRIASKNSFPYSATAPARLSAVEPTTAVPLFNRILVAGSLSAIGSERHCHGQGAVPNHPAQTAQDWRTGARHRTQSLGVVLQRLPGPGAVRPCLSATPLLTPAAVQLFDKSFAISASSLGVVRLPVHSAGFSATSPRLCAPAALPSAVPALFVRRSG